MAASRAAKQMNCAVKMEQMTPGILRKRSMSLVAFVDWLLASHCHFIICHVHQNNVSPVGWPIDELYEELQRLKYHNGWPNGDKLNCPIFGQDK